MYSIYYTDYYISYFIYYTDYYIMYFIYYTDYYILYFLHYTLYIHRLYSYILYIIFYILFSLPQHPPTPQWARAASFLRFLYHTQRRTTISRTPLDERSGCRRDFYLTTHTTLTRDRHPCPPVGFEPVISAGERPQTDALDRAATGTRLLYIV